MQQNSVFFKRLTPYLCAQFGLKKIMQVIVRFGYRSGIIVLIGMILSGCASVVNTQVSAFRTPGDLPLTGTIWVNPMQQELQRSLEFAWYKTQLESALSQLGYRIAIDLQSADFIALLDYSVEKAEADRSGTYFTTGWGFNRSRYYGGVNTVIVDDQRRQSFYRTVHLVIESNQPEAPRLYEVKGVSQGRCGVLSIVFDEMIAAMLQGYPIHNATVKTVQVKGDARC